MESRLSSSGNSISKDRSEVASWSLSNVDLKLLRVFKCVVEQGGFTSASNELNIGLAAISKQISDLEVRVGMSLCSRGRDGFSLTEQGVVVYEACIELFSSIHVFRDRLYNTRHEILGEIHIGIIDNIISEPQLNITKAVQYIYNHAPKVTIRLHSAPYDELMRGLNEGRFTCIISPMYEQEEEYDCYPIYREESDLYCGQQHSLFNYSDADLSLDILREQILISHTYACSFHHKNSYNFQSSNIQATQVESVAMLIMTGLFIGFLPKHYAAAHVRAGTMRALRPEAFNLFTDFALYVKKGKSANKIMRLFMDGMQIRAS